MHENIAPSRSLVRRAAAASLIGTTVEWYDYFIFGSASALVFGKLFFPDSTPLVGTLSSFAVFGVGFFARPLGGIVFGHIGDRVGRKTALVTTLLIMGIATFCVGLLPTAHTIGVGAPILLVVLRLVQGFGVGGEWGGASLVAVEFAPAGRRGRYGSAPQVGNALGVALSTGAFAAVSQLPDAQLYSWGWRIPFLASAILIVAGLLIRLRLTETPAFTAARERAELAAAPLKDALRHSRKPILLAAGMRVSENVFGYIILTFLLSYGTDRLHLSRGVLLSATTVAAIAGMAACYGFGALSDRVGRRPVFLFGAVFSAVFAFPMFALLDLRATPMVVIAVVLAYTFGVSAQYGVEPSFFAELFGTGVRYTGMSLSSQIAAVFAGGLAPFIATALTGAAGGRPWPVAAYVLVASLITVVAVLGSAETFRATLSRPEPAAPDTATTPTTSPS
ncbi:MFS transporter [Actinoallomurus acaciae]|uniref:MFS transporter n=1 Tax=Actinoallomurus acaciae TaxID=502577 RepID=A0ABV5YPG2_9ACTN